MKKTTNINKHAPRNMGKMIQQILKARGILVSDFAKTIHCSRTNVYNIFKRKTIDINLLRQIVDVLELNMSDFISLEKRCSNRCIAVIEIEEDKLEQLTSDYVLTYVKVWKTK